MECKCKCTEVESVGCQSKKAENWMNKNWRPAMAWLYGFTCFFDFVLAPVGWAFFQVHYVADKIQIDQLQWVPITLQSGGLYHVAMGAVLGVTAWSRGQEKMKGVANGY